MNDQIGIGQINHAVGIEGRARSPSVVDVAGQRVFICCKGCENKLKQEPQKYLAKLKR